MGEGLEWLEELLRQKYKHLILVSQPFSISTNLSLSFLAKVCAQLSFDQLFIKGQALPSSWEPESHKTRTTEFASKDLPSTI